MSYKDTIRAIKCRIAELQEEIEELADQAVEECPYNEGDPVAYEGEIWNVVGKFYNSDYEVKVVIRIEDGPSWMARRKTISLEDLDIRIDNSLI